MNQRRSRRRAITASTKKNGKFAQVFDLSTFVQEDGWSSIAVLLGEPEALLATLVSKGGVLVVASGGTADPTTIFSGSSEIVGADFGAQVSGGKLLVRSGGTALDVMRARSATLPTCDSMVAG
jgi:autotransporter passenger strand-loop-strand repeat protein